MRVESISYRVEHGSNESASLLNSFPFEKTTHRCSHCANPALVAYNPGSKSHSKVISLLKILLSAIALLSSARFVTSQPCNAIVLAERKMETLNSNFAARKICHAKGSTQQNVHI